MSASDSTSSAAPSGNWLANQPYLLLCLTSLFWAGNAIVGRLAAGHIPPVTFSFLRWGLAFLIMLPFAWNISGATGRRSASGSASWCFCRSPASPPSTCCNTGRWNTPRR